MMGPVMEEQRSNPVRRAVKALLRVALGIAIFAALAPAPASSGPALKVCPSVHAISV